MPTTKPFAHIAPFALFMAFIGAESSLVYLVGNGILPGIVEMDLLYVYPAKALAVGLVLLYFYRRNAYPEVDFRELLRPGDSALSVVVGLLVFAGWIHLGELSLGASRGYDPTAVGNGSLRLALVAFRLGGAALVVPMMEEIFWRSFLMRYLIAPDFQRVAVGRFTWSSFLFTALLFGLEHHLFVAGVLAGMVYAGLLYRTKSIVQCILCHAVTNLALGLFVLRSGQWRFW